MVGWPGHENIAAARSGRCVYLLRRWAKGLSRSYRTSLSRGQDATLHHPPHQKQHGVRAVETAQEGKDRFEVKCAKASESTFWRNL